jgi:hypothetical protein
MAHATIDKGRDTLNLILTKSEFRGHFSTAQKL